MNAQRWKNLVGATAVAMGLLWSGNCVATEFDSWGNSVDTYGSSAYGRSNGTDQLDRYRQEQDRQGAETYRRSQEEYASKPSYESTSSWVTRPGGKVSQCVPDYYNEKVIHCY